MLTEFSFILPGRYLDVPRLISWLSSRQYAPEGGFSGRTNKLVDGCYSHWIGGCWPLVEAALSGSAVPGPKGTLPPYEQSLYSREGLIRYIMCCCQDLSKRGGLRDKPGRYVITYLLRGRSLFRVLKDPLADLPQSVGCVSLMLRAIGTKLRTAYMEAGEQRFHRPRTGRDCRNRRCSRTGGKGGGRGRRHQEYRCRHRRRSCVVVGLTVSR